MPTLPTELRRKLESAIGRESDTGGAPRKYYDLTNDGRKALERKRKEWREVRDAMEVFLLRGRPS